MSQIPEDDINILCVVQRSHSDVDMEDSHSTVDVGDSHSDVEELSTQDEPQSDMLKGASSTTSILTFMIWLAWELLTRTSTSMKHRAFAVNKPWGWVG